MSATTARVRPIGAMLSLGNPGRTRGNGMGWFDKIQRAVGVPDRGSRREEAVRLRSEVVRLYREDHFAEAARVARELIDWQQAEIGEAHPDFALGLLNLALILRKEGDHPGATRVVERAASIRLTTLGPDHPETLEARSLVDAWRAEPPARPLPDHEPPISIPRPSGEPPTAPALQAPGLILAIAELSESAHEAEPDRA